MRQIMPIQVAIFAGVFWAFFASIMFLPRFDQNPRVREASIIVR
jgi:hypothetical protein